jgi:hypothetical protein
MVDRFVRMQCTSENLRHYKTMLRQVGRAVSQMSELGGDRHPEVSVMHKSYAGERADGLVGLDVPELALAISVALAKLMVGCGAAALGDLADVVHLSPNRSVSDDVAEAEPAQEMCMAPAPSLRHQLSAVGTSFSVG